MRYQSLLILTELLSLSLSVSWRNNSSETGDNVSDVTRTFIFFLPPSTSFSHCDDEMRIRIIYGGKSLGGIECFSFSGKCVRNDMERVRRPDVLGLTREAIFLGLTVSVY